MFRHFLDQHAGDAACLFSRREAASGRSRYRLADLAFLDERIDAHLDGLRLAGADGWEACLDALDAAEEPEDLFAPAAIAAEQDDPRPMGKVLDVTKGEPPGLAIIAGAIAWASPAAVTKVIERMLAPRCPPVLHALGISASVKLGKDPGPALERALSSNDLGLASRAIQAAGELGREDLLPVLRQELQGDREPCRAWAAWSAVLLGDAHALPHLARAALAPGPAAAAALDLALRRSDPARAGELLHAAIAAPGRMREAIAGIGALGDPGWVPWLLQAMADPAHARLAGESFSLITGVDLAARKLEAPAPAKAEPSDDPAEDDVADDPDRLLPWPNAAAVTALWEKQHASFPAGARRLLGQPISAEWLAQVLRDGHQNARAAAAIELRALHPHAPLRDVRAPGFRQLAG
ncbi:MAG: TIGR02270 family protein [Byssovorax sp.]